MAASLRSISSMRRIQPAHMDRVPCHPPACRTGRPCRTRPRGTTREPADHAVRPAHLWPAQPGLGQQPHRVAAAAMPMSMACHRGRVDDQMGAPRNRGYQLSPGSCPPEHGIDLWQSFPQRSGQIHLRGSPARSGSAPRPPLAAVASSDHRTTAVARLRDHPGAAPPLDQFGDRRQSPRRTCDLGTGPNPDGTHHRVVVGRREVGRCSPSNIHRLCHARVTRNEFATDVTVDAPGAQPLWQQPSATSSGIAARRGSRHPDRPQRSCCPLRRAAGPPHRAQVRPAGSVLAGAPTPGS